MSKTQIAILCGGQSAEHEISLVSAANIVDSMDEARYDVCVIYISQHGTWHLLQQPQDVGAVKPLQLMTEKHSDQLLLLPGESEAPFCLVKDTSHKIKVDCVFPVLHGPKGEDGTMQGLLEILGVPYVGCDVMSAALCMEKHATKQCLRAHDLPTADWLFLRDCEIDTLDYDTVREELGPVVFVKPANLGSSVGISKVKQASEFKPALQEAFRYDDKLIIEQFIPGREIECSVMGNDEPVASLPGEVVVHAEFYDYDAKYVNLNGSTIVSPADLPKTVVKRIQELAVKAFRSLHCVGMVRVDFFVTEQEQVLINELNPIPGFTDISLYLKNWQASGIDFGESIHNLIQLALAYHHKQQRLSHTLKKLIEKNQDPEQLSQ